MTRRISTIELWCQINPCIFFSRKSRGRNWQSYYWYQM